MDSKETPTASAELTSENIHAVITTRGPLHEGTVVNLAMTESTALSLYEEWMETLPSNYNGGVRPLSWARKYNLTLDPHAEAETFK